MLLVNIPADPVPFLILDLVYILFTNLGSQAVIEQAEDLTYEDIRVNHMHRVYAQNYWTLFGIPLQNLLIVQVIFNLVLYLNLRKHWMICVYIIIYICTNI